MSLISHNELVELVMSGVITADIERVNGSSIDITLDDVIRVERKTFCGVVDLVKKESIKTYEIDLSDQFFLLEPNCFILASSREMFNLPNNISAEYKLKSSMARNGLEHLNAGWCDAGWNNSKLTLELKNMTQCHTLKLTPGMAIGQMVFFKHKPVPDSESYAIKGQYNNQEKVTESKGLR